MPLLSPLSGKKFCTPPPPQVSRLLEGATPFPSFFNKGWGAGERAPTMIIYQYHSQNVTLANSLINIVRFFNRDRHRCKICSFFSCGRITVIYIELFLHF